MPHDLGAYRPGPTEIDGAEDRELRRLLKMQARVLRELVLWQKDFAQAVKAVAPGLQIPAAPAVLGQYKDAVTDILGRHDAMRTP